MLITTVCVGSRVDNEKHTIHKGKEEKRVTVRRRYVQRKKGEE